MFIIYYTILLMISLICGLFGVLLASMLFNPDHGTDGKSVTLFTFVVVSAGTFFYIMNAIPYTEFH